jgi:hypothetical protein
VVVTLDQDGKAEIALDLTEPDGKMKSDVAGDIRGASVSCDAAVKDDGAVLKMIPRAEAIEASE